MSSCSFASLFILCFLEVQKNLKRNQSRFVCFVFLLLAFALNLAPGSHNESLLYCFLGVLNLSSNISFSKITFVFILLEEQVEFPANKRQTSSSGKVCPFFGGKSNPLRQ